MHGMQARAIWRGAAWLGRAGGEAQRVQGFVATNDSHTWAFELLSKLKLLALFHWALEPNMTKNRQQAPNRLG